MTTPIKLSEIEETEFRNLVRRELVGALSYEEVDALESDPELWRDELVLALQELDRQFTAKRAEAPVAQLHPTAYRKYKSEYQTWKSEAAARKAKICERLRDVKSLVKDVKRAEEPKNVKEKGRPLEPVLLDNLQELRGLRADLLRHK